MAEVSNKTVVALLAIALVITVVGTVVSVSKLNNMGGQYTVLTGAATTGTGTTSLTVQGVAAIVVNNASITLRTGYWNTSCSRLYSLFDTGNDTENDDYDADTHCWIDSTYSTLNISGNKAWHVINNTGTTIVNITANITASSTSGASALNGLNATEILCGAGNCPGQSSNALIRIYGAEHEAASCIQDILANAGTLADTTAATTVQTVCQRLGYEDAADELRTYFVMQVPNDVDQGAKAFTVTYSATAK